MHRKKPVPRASYNEVAGLEHATLFKKRPWHRCFPVNFVKFLRTRFFKERLRWLLLKCGRCKNEAREINCLLLQRWMQYLLLRLKSRSSREASHHPAFMSNFPTIHVLALSALVDEFSVLFLVYLNEMRTLVESGGMNKGCESKICFVTSGVWLLPLRPTASEVAW